MAGRAIGRSIAPHEILIDAPPVRREVEFRARTANDIREVLPENVALVDLLEYWHFPKAGKAKLAAGAHLSSGDVDLDAPVPR